MLTSVHIDEQGVITAQYSNGQSRVIDNIVLATFPNGDGLDPDLAIQGHGFFVVQNNQGTNFYTRAGQLNLDKDGFLVNAEGLKVQGMKLDSNGNPVSGPYRHRYQQWASGGSHANYDYRYGVES